MRPAGIPDPRKISVTSTEIRVDDPEEDARRSRVTVGELMEGAPNPPIDYEEIDFRAIIIRMGPERWDELRRRFALILALLHERRQHGGE